MEFRTLYHELQNSTEMIRALLLGVTQEDAEVNPGNCLPVELRRARIENITKPDPIEYTGDW